MRNGIISFIWVAAFCLQSIYGCVQDSECSCGEVCSSGFQCVFSYSCASTTTTKATSSCRGSDCTTEAPPIVDPGTAAAGATVLAAAAVAPPPLPMMVPQGLPQPGAVASGGGILPTTALAV